MNIRDRVAQILETGAMTYDSSKKQVLFSAGTHVDAILDLIEQTCNEARVDELSKIPIRSCDDPNDDTSVVWWHGYYAPEFQKRLKQLMGGK